MIKSVMFDMGGTLEDIWVDAESEKAAIVKLMEMLESYGFHIDMSYEDFKEEIDQGWVRYGLYRDATGIECKPIEIWCDYILKNFPFSRDLLEPHCEEIAHMWEITHYHRKLRPRVKEMLDELRSMGLKLGVISNTAALYQVFDSLKEYGIREYFSDVTLSSVTGMRKPGVDIFNVSLLQMQAAPEESAYIGDTISRDIIGSMKAGYGLSIQILSKLTREKDLGVDPKYIPPYRIEDIYDVAEIIRKVNETAAPAV